MSIFSKPTYKEVSLPFISHGREVIVRLKYKKDCMVDFTIFPEGLAKAYGDDRSLELELSGWGMNGVSCKERSKV